MKIESPAFTIDDVHAFMDVYLDRERHLLADRLEAASSRLAELGPRIRKERSEGEDWTAHELLAHIAVLSKYYGVLVHQVATGRIDDLGIMPAVNARDAAGDRAAEMDPDQLLAMVLSDHRHTAEELRSADVAALRRSARFDGEHRMTAEEIARLPLVSHLETHIEQLERLLEAP